MSINTVPVKSRILEIAMDTPNFHSIITTYRKWFKIHQFFFHSACHTFSNSIFRGAPGAPLPPIKLEKIWFFTRNTPKMFAPPSARRNLFKCSPPPPLTWNPGSAPDIYQYWKSENQKSAQLTFFHKIRFFLPLKTKLHSRDSIKDKYHI